MRVFLAGATGFIGGHALRALLARGHEVTCLVRPGARLPRPLGVRVVAGEWTAPDGWLGTVAGHDAVVNAVWDYPRDAWGELRGGAYDCAAGALRGSGARRGAQGGAGERAGRG